MIETSFVLTAHPAAALHLLLPDLIYFPFSDFIFTITHSSLIASCSANRVHCIWSCFWQPEKALSLILILSGFFSASSLPHVCYTSPPFKALCSTVCGCLAVCFHLLFSIGRFKLSEGQFHEGTDFIHIFTVDFILKLFSHNTGSVKMYLPNKWIQVLSR